MRITEAIRWQLVHSPFACGMTVFWAIIGIGCSAGGHFEAMVGCFILSKLHGNDIQQPPDQSFEGRS